MVSILGLGLFNNTATEANAAEANTVTTLQQGVDDFSFDEYDAHYTISKDEDGRSSVSVEEKFVARFPDYIQNKGIVRNIPLKYDGIESAVDFHAVVDESGNMVPASYYVSNDNLVVEVGDDTYLQGIHTFVLSYTIHDAVRWFPKTETEEFYWNTNGGDWAQSFAKANVTVEVDADISGSLTGDIACYRGLYGVNTPCNIASDGGQSFEVTETALAPNENITVALGFEKGTFETPKDETPLIIGIVIAMFLALGGFATWLLKKKHKLGQTGARPSKTVIAEYTAPTEEDLFTISQVMQVRPSEAEIKSSGSVVAATIIKLAINRNINIIETNKKEFGYETLNKDNLTDSELLFLQAMENHAPKDSAGNILLTGRSEALGSAVSNISAQYPEAVKRAGYVKAAPRLSKKVVWSSLGILLVTAIAEYFLINNTTSSWGVVMGAFVIGVLLIPSLVIIAGILPPSNVLTEKGAELKEQLQGVALYIKVAEKDRMAFLQSVKGAERSEGGSDGDVVKLYEKLLPIAILLGLEKSWSDTLTALYESNNIQPTWTNNMPLVYLSLFVNKVSTSASVSTSPPPSSSGSGGAGGGGFSGGGGGGGGGGGR